MSVCDAECNAISADRIELLTRAVNLVAGMDLPEADRATVLARVLVPTGKEARQAGGGTAYAITERITLDIGYRFFQIANSTSPAVISYVPGPPVGSEVVGSAFSASELFFAFRIYEPFRNWR